tara:strand:- start:940 stop:1092 length:153 start_codon:yes stop_codon:yes gene_type:complete
MNNKITRLLFRSLLILVLISVAATFYRYVVERDFEAIDDTEDYEEEVLDE